MLSARNRLRLSLSPNTPARWLATLADDPSAQIRRNVAKHPSSPIEVTEHLLLDASAGVRRIAAARVLSIAITSEFPPIEPATLSRLATDEEDVCLVLVATHPASPPEAIAIATTKSGWHQYSAAIHPNTPPEVLTRLAGGEGDPYLRERVVRRSDVPVEALKLLLSDRDPSIRKAALEHPRLPAHLKAIVALAE